MSCTLVGGGPPACKRKEIKAADDIKHRYLHWSKVRILLFLSLLSLWTLPLTLLTSEEIELSLKMQSFSCLSYACAANTIMHCIHAIPVPRHSPPCYHRQRLDWWWEVASHHSMQDDPEDCRESHWTIERRSDQLEGPRCPTHEPCTVHLCCLPYKKVQ